MAAWSAHLLLAAVAYIPLLRTAPGMVEDDSKQYLYIDPARFMSQVVSMWNPDVSMGTVTHQYIGYLLPMGPYYALMNVLGVPTWVAQRLWTGSLLFLAGAGRALLVADPLAPGRPRVRRHGTGTGSPTPVARHRFARHGTIGGVGAMVAALAYMLSPYVLQNEARQSALLLPWVGLPWMIGLTARALRRGGWRHAALFALVVALVGSTNAVALILVGVGPALWVVWELVAGRVRWRRALTTALKIAGARARRCRCGGPPGSSSRAPTAWTSCATPSRSRPWRGPAWRRRPCEDSGTGSSTVSTSWASICPWRRRT